MISHDLKNTVMKRIQRLVNIPVDDKVNIPVDDIRENNPPSMIGIPDRVIIDDIIELRDNVYRLKLLLYDQYFMYGKKVVAKPNKDWMRKHFFIDEDNSFDRVCVIGFIDDYVDVKTTGWSKIKDAHILITKNEKINKDRITVSSLHTMNRVLNNTTIEYFERFDIRVYVYDDDDEYKIKHYMKLIEKALIRDFQIENHGDEVTRDTAYIYNALKFELDEQNITSRIAYGSILIKYYEITKGVM